MKKDILNTLSLRTTLFLLIGALIFIAPIGCGDDNADDNANAEQQPEDDAVDDDAANADATDDDADSADEDDTTHEPDPNDQYPSTGPGADITDCSVPITREELRLTNEARAEEGLGELRCDLGLTRSATLHARDMCENNYFSHDSIDGRDLQDRVNETSVQWTMIGENIAMGQPSAKEVHEGWMNSPGHRANILTPEFGRIGIAFVRCEGGPYWVQNFAN